MTLNGHITSVWMLILNGCTFVHLLKIDNAINLILRASGTVWWSPSFLTLRTAAIQTLPSTMISDGKVVNESAMYVKRIQMYYIKHIGNFSHLNQPIGHLT